MVEGVGMPLSTALIAVGSNSTWGNTCVWPKNCCFGHKEHLSSLLSVLFIKKEDSVTDGLKLDAFFLLCDGLLDQTNINVENKNHKFSF